MASLEKRPAAQGRGWRIRYRLDGIQKTTYLSEHITKTEAQSILAQFNKRLAEHKLGIRLFSSPLEKEVLTISELHDWFLANKPAAKDTLYIYSYSIKQLYKVMSSTTNIARMDIGNFSLYLSTLNPTTQGVIVRSLRAVWNFAIERGILKTNPFHKIKVKQEKRFPKILPIEQKDRIFEHIEHPIVRLGYQIARYTGLRREEICSLTWDDILWKRNMINIPKAKTGIDQLVPMPSVLRDILLEHKGEGQVVPVNPDTLTHYIKRAMREAGIFTRGSIHLLRHSFASELLTQGVDIRIIQLLLRHSHIGTTMIYTELPTASLLESLNDKKL